MYIFTVWSIIFMLVFYSKINSIPKDQLISKGLFGVFNSSKKRMKNFCPSSLGQKLKFLFRFLEELETPKFPFEINWPLTKKVNVYVHIILLCTYFHILVAVCILHIAHFLDWRYILYFFIILINFILIKVHLGFSLNHWNAYAF